MAGLTFIFTNDYTIGIEQLIAILKQESVPVNVVLSKYNFVEMGHLQYMAEHDEGASKKKARDLLDADRERIAEDVKKQSPEIVGFSITTDTYRWCLSLAAKIKEKIPGRPIVVGGAHSTFSPERLISHKQIDAICIGEVDLSIVDIYKALSGKIKKEGVPGAWFKKDGKVIKNPLAPLARDLDSLPFKDAEPFVKINPELGKLYHAVTSRGCPFNCSYCNSSAYKRMYGKAYLRKRSSGSVLRELEQARKKYDIKKIQFVDDVFTMDRKWLSDFLPRYKEKIGLPFYCLIHPEMVEGDTVSLLKDAGCECIKCGIQTVNPALSREVYSRALNLDKVKNVIRTVKESGIALKLDFIIGAPTETEQDLKDLVAFIKEVRVDDIFLYFLKYYPGTRIIEYALKHGHITKDSYEAYHEGSDAPYFIIPNRFGNKTKALYSRYNDLIRNAAGSHFSIEQFNYLLKEGN